MRSRARSKAARPAASSHSGVPSSWQTQSAAAAAKAAGVAVVTGDTKVVERGKGDGVFITTTGFGVVPDGVDVSASRARPGDRVIVSGPVGDHGVAIMSLRENLTFSEAATPRTMERYTRNEDGALYGFALTPDQIGPGRPLTDTPLPGLHLAGHWTQPGGGIYGVVTSGIQSAREVLEHSDAATR